MGWGLLLGRQSFSLARVTTEEKILGLLVHQLLHPFRCLVRKRVCGPLPVPMCLFQLLPCHLHHGVSYCILYDYHMMYAPFIICGRPIYRCCYLLYACYE